MEKQLKHPSRKSYRKEANGYEECDHEFEDPATKDRNCRISAAECRDRSRDAANRCRV